MSRRRVGKLVGVAADACRRPFLSGAQAFCVSSVQPRTMWPTCMSRPKRASVRRDCSRALAPTPMHTLLTTTYERESTVRLCTSQHQPARAERRRTTSE